MSGFLSLMGWTFLPDVSSPTPLSANSLDHIPR